METFLWELFKDLKGLNKVLDIGGFIGESAIYLSMQNKEVYTFELSPTNFRYLKENCKNINNIKCYNGCIGNSDDEFMLFSDIGEVSSINTKEQKTGKKIKIKNYNIIQLLKNNKFDGLKIDIEGGEYDIIKPIIDSGLFKFKKGIIEFHNLNKLINRKYVEKFIVFLQTNGFHYKIFDNEKNTVKIGELMACNIYFEK